jgi:hypothetical protein
MSGRFQFSLRTMMAQATLIAMGIALFQAVGEGAGAIGSSCLVELSGASFGAALGLFFKQPGVFATAGAMFFLPLAGMAFVTVGGIGC